LEANWYNFSIIISLVTGTYLYLGNREAIASASSEAIFLAVIIALPLALFNSFNETIITRWTIVEGFSKNPKVAAIIGALIFGIPHYFGVPGGLPGSIMAGFLGWFLVRSIFDTKGIGWAIIIHFLQDVLIFSVLLLGVLP